MVIVIALIFGLAFIWLGMLLFAVAYHLWPITLLFVLWLFYRERNRMEMWRRGWG